MNSFVNIIIVLLLETICAQDVFETVEAVVGHSAELPCNATAEDEDDKLTILAWYKNNSSTAFYSRDLRDGAQITSSTSSGRYRLITADSDGLDNLQIITVRPSDAGLYHCLADFASSPAHKTYVQLFVIEPPRVLWVVHDNSTEIAKASAGVNVSRNVGPYYVGETVHLFCVAFGGKPQATLSWWSEQRLLKNTSTPLSEHRVRSDVMFGPLRREDHGRVLTCHARNNDKTAPLSIDIIIDMYLPAELVSLRVEGGASGTTAGRVRAGDALGLQCRVLGARPPPAISWRLNHSQLLNLEQNVTKEPSQRLVVSDILLTMSQEHDESHVTCCAPAHLRGNDSLVCAQGLPLTVLYAPILQIDVEAVVVNNTLAIVKGSDVSLACNYKANPSVYQLIWFHEEDIVSNENESTDKIQPILELVNVKESDSGEYVCAATNDEGSSYSEPLVIDVTYPTYCEDDSTVEYGVGENESINLTCTVKGNPAPSSYRWAIVNESVNASTLRNHPHTTLETENNTLLFERPNNISYNTIFCWGVNNIPSKGSPHSPCSFLVTDETMPRPPTNCAAMKTATQEIIVKCEKGHDGGLPQKFKFIVKEMKSDEHLVSITNLEPEFMIPEPKQENYKFVVVAFNSKGDSTEVEIGQDDIIVESEEVKVAQSAVSNITTLALALCGGVALVALAACGLVLCAHERHERTERSDLPRARDPPLCAYNTEESNCETYHDSEDGSEYNVRRTDSFRKAVTKYPTKNYDVRRTSSMHSARYMHEADPEGNKCHEIRRNPNCRVHSLQNISRKREMDGMCDHFVLHLPPETTNYNTPRPMNTFYTMPRKMRQKLAKELSDENSEITQSDGFSLPPPPDEFGTYRAASRIKDIPKYSPTYTTVVRQNSTGKDPTKYQQYSNQALAPMNTVGLPTISGVHNSVYTYPDDRGHPVNTNPFDEDSA